MANAGWGTGAFLSALLRSRNHPQPGGKRRSVAFSMAIIRRVHRFASSLAMARGRRMLYGGMGSARGVGGIAMNRA